MRPIYLKLAGLHSFRETQEVDFDQLCQGGVFGIFGPTGSGKSSLLDAITLALFGKVERAANNTTGIMNQGEDSLSVSFSFELRNANGAKRFRVERNYKRSGSDEQRLRSASSRLVEIIDEEELVIADKDREVTSQVEEILGLSAEDFTRAVVLPQGKFAEFLTLNGSERRKMLQRLFNLEKYGDRLAIRLKTRKDEATHKIDQIHAEQQGLGDASQKTLAEAKKRLEEAAQILESKRLVLIEKEKEFEEKRKLWQWQQEKEKLDRELIHLKEQEIEINELENLLKKSEQAERLRPYMEELRTAEKEVEDWQGRAQDAEKQWSKAKISQGIHQQEYEVARHKRSEEEPRIAVQIESLKQAEEYLIAIKRGEEELAIHIEQLEQIERELAAREIEEQKIVVTLEKALTRQNEIKTELGEKSIKADTRQRLMEAIQSKQHLSLIQKEVEQCQGELQNKEAQWKEYQQQERLLQASMQEIDEKLFLGAEEIIHNYDSLSELGRSLKRIEGDLTIALRTHREAIAREQENHLAQQLASLLHDGQPCPVCGSLEHPHPVKGSPSDVKGKLEIDVQGIEDLIETCIEKGHQIEQLKLRLEHLSKRLHEHTMDQTDPKVNQVKRTIHEIAVNLDPSASDQFLIDAVIPVGEHPHLQKKPQIDLISTHIEEMAKRVTQLESNCEREFRELTQLKQKRSELEIYLKNINQILTELRDKEVVLKQDFEMKMQTWQNQYPNFSYDTVETVQQEMNQRDREIEVLNERLQKSVDFIEKYEQDQKKLTILIRDLEKRYLQSKNEVGSRKKNLLEHSERFRFLTGGEDPGKKLLQLTQSLEQLKREEATAKLRFEEMDQLLRQREGKYTAAVQSANLALTRLTGATEKWERMILETNFLTRVEVEESLISKEVQVEWRSQIETYRDTVKALEAKRKEMINLLNGVSITEADWHKILEDVRGAKAAYELSLHEKAQVERDFEELERKSIRWRELENERKVVQQLLDRLGVLQAVFRGNAFVDFIAEEQLIQISRDASARLERLTRGRYAIEIDSTGGFIIRDDANGGVRRPVTTLSGGETFLTSLALALSLSAQVQLRGEYPLEFFFLDEGFGTLDQELLDTVISSLEQLQSDSLSIGIISHVPELRERIMRRITVEAAQPSGRGSKVKLEVV